MPFALDCQLKFHVSWDCVKTALAHRAWHAVPGDLSIFTCELAAKAAIPMVMHSSHGGTPPSSCLLGVGAVMCWLLSRYQHPLWALCLSSLHSACPAHTAAEVMGRLEHQQG